MLARVELCLDLAKISAKGGQLCSCIVCQRQFCSSHCWKLNVGTSPKEDLNRGSLRCELLASAAIPNTHAPIW